MNLETLIKNQVKTNKPKNLTRIKVGRVLSFIAALPLGTSPLFLISAPMMLPISPTLWAKDKINNFNQWRLLR